MEKKKIQGKDLKFVSYIYRDTMSKVSFYSWTTTQPPNVKEILNEEEFELFPFDRERANYITHSGSHTFIVKIKEQPPKEESNKGTQYANQDIITWKEQAEKWRKLDDEVKKIVNQEGPFFPGSMNADLARLVIHTFNQE